MQLGRESENIGLFYWYLQRLERWVGGLQVLTVRWELLWGLCWPQGMELLAMSEMWFFSSDGTWNQDAVEEKYTYIFCLGKGTDIIHSFYHHWQMFADTLLYKLSFLVAQMVKSLPAMWETGVQSLGQEDTLEKEMATHSSTLAWKIPWMEEPERLQSMVSQRVRHNWATSLSFSFFLSYKLKYQQIIFSFFWSRPFLKSWLNLLYYRFCFMFRFFGHEACGILASWLGLNLHPLCLQWIGRQSPNHWITRAVSSNS